MTSDNLERPASFTQRQFWIVQQQHGDSTEYNLPFVYRLSGHLNAEALGRSMDEIVRRHEILRTTLEPVAGKLCQVVHAAKPGVLTQLVLEERGLAQALASIQREVRRPFDLESDPPIRALLIPLAEEDHVFGIIWHHTAVDEQSTYLFSKELESLYCAFALGETSPLSEPGKQYADLVEWQADWVGSPQCDKKLSYWTSQLEGRKSILDLPTDHHRPAANSSAGDEVEFELSEGIHGALNEFCTQATVSHTVALLAGYFALLSKCTGQNEVTIGVPFANRGRTKGEESMGCFINTLPLNVDLSEDPSYVELVRTVRKTVLAANQRQEVPFETIVRAVQPERDPRLNPLYQHCFTMQRAPMPVLLKGLKAKALHVHNEGSKFDSTIEMWDCPDEQRIRGLFEYKTSLFEEVSIRRLIERYQQLLGQVLADPSLRLSQLDVLTPDERALLFPREDSANARNEKLSGVIDWFEESVAGQPNKSAIHFGSETLSYHELDIQVRSLDCRLRALGVGPGAMVGVCLERSPRIVVALLATLRAGGAYVTIDPKYPEDRIAFMLEETDPLVLLSEEHLRYKFDAARQDRVLCLDDQPTTTEDVVELDPVTGEIAYVIFTSGSTGRPKGVEVRSHGLNAFLQAMLKKPGLKAEDRLLAVTTISFDIIALDFFLPLAVGASVRIVPYETAINGEELLKVLSNDQITMLQATPATFRMLIASGWKRTEKLRILCGGEAMPYELAQELLKRSEEVWNVYGPTETTVWCSVKCVQPNERPVSIGRPIEGTQMYVLNDYLQPVPIGVAGELCIGGDGVARGYLGRDDLTAEQFVPNPYSSVPGSRMYKTGDLVRFLPNLELECLGRIDFQVKIRGFRIEPGEIEAVFDEQNSVRVSVVVAYPDASGEQALAAYFVPEQFEDATQIGAIREHLRSKLPAYMMPSAIIPLETMPLTPNGKIDRKALPVPTDSDAAQMSEDYVEPGNDFEISLTAVWQRVLGIDRVGITDNFFDHGGHSILALDLVKEMERATGVTIDLGTIFTAPTIKELVANLDSDVSTKASSIVPLQPEGDGTCLFCLCGIHLYQDFANSLGTSQPVYGIYVAEEQALLERAVKGETADVSISRLAETYRDAICRQQSHGPYQLAGLSFGGILAIETARLLQERGEEVAIVVLLDTVLRRGIRRDKLRWVLLYLRKLSAKGASYYLERVSAGVREWLRRRGLAANDSTRTAIESADGAMFRERAYIQAMEVYDSEITPYDGNVVLMRATDHSDWGSGTRLVRDYGWGDLLSRTLQIHDVPGKHLDIVQSPNSDRLAKILRSYLLDHSEE